MSLFPVATKTQRTLLKWGQVHPYGYGHRQKAVGPIKLISWKRETFLTFKGYRLNKVTQVLDLVACYYSHGISWKCHLCSVLQLWEPCERGYQEVIEKADIGGSTFPQNIRTYVRRYMVLNPSQNLFTHYISNTLKFVIEMTALLSGFSEHKIASPSILSF
jgi:hypothetical protein